MTRILVVDDDKEIRELLKIILTGEQYEVILASDGVEALQKINDQIDLVILDIMMPNKNGIDTCIDIRKDYMVPILFLTAKGTEYDKYIGFSMGCDDYLVKPFARMELLARVNALIRRYTVYLGKETVAEGVIQISDLKIDEYRNTVTRNEQEISLTNIEYHILLLLAKQPDKVFTIENIYESVWNMPYDYLVNSTVMVHIKNLRRKLDNGSTNYIKNVWGRGYCIEKNI